MPRKLKPPPPERANWNSMNEGQKRYAMEQYNKALVHRGHYFTPPSSPTAPNSPEGFSRQELDAIIDEHFPGEPAEDTSDKEEEDADNTMSAGTSTGTPMEITDNRGPQVFKRGADSTLKSPAKKQKAATTTGSALPGTSGNMNAGTGGALGGAEGGGAIIIPRGINNTHIDMVFKKTWKFLSYGVANNIIGTTQYALTTALANLPWEYLFFYCSPAERDVLLGFQGVFARKAKMSVRALNTRVAFQTGDTNSTTATYNQNKFTLTAVGLRNNAALYGENCTYTFDNSEPMKVTGVNPVNATYRNSLQQDLYGLANTSSDFSTRVPVYVTGGEIALGGYYTLYVGNTGSAGYQPLMNYVKEVNAMDVLGQEIINVEHNFKYAPLTPRPKAIINYSDTVTSNSNAEISSGTNRENIQVLSKDTGGNLNPIAIDSLNTSYVGNMNGTNYTYFSANNQYYTYPMEQSGTFNESNKGHHDAGLQQSVHVGVRAVPKLSTNAASQTVESWSDTQAYWVIDCELHCTADYPFVYSRDGPRSLPTLAQSVIGKVSGTPAVFKAYRQTYDGINYLAQPNLLLDS